MSKVYKRKDTGKWGFSINHDGKRTRRHHWNTRREAEMALHKFIDDLNEHIRGVNLNVLINVLMNQFRDDWMAQNTSDSYKKRLNNIYNNINRYFKDNKLTKVSEIDFEVVQGYRNLRKLKMERSPKTINAEMDYFRNMLELGINLNMLRVNSALKIKRQRLTKNRYPKYFSEDELNVIFTTKGKYHGYYMILLYTGLRAGDAANLTWNNIDMDKGKTGYIEVIMQKTKKKVSIPIAPPLRRYLLDYPTNENLLFKHLNIDIDPKRDKVRYNLHKILEKSGFPLEIGKALHVFRHTFASWHVMNGTDILQVKEWLGHESIVETDIYAHLKPTSGAQFLGNINFDPDSIVSETSRILNQHQESNV